MGCRAGRAGCCAHCLKMLGGGWGGSPCQRHSGARSYRDRCSLPGLAGLTALRRGGTDRGHRRNLQATHGSHSARSGAAQRAARQAHQWRRGRDSNPRNGFKPFTHFPGVLLQPLGHLSTDLTYVALDRLAALSLHLRQLSEPSAAPTSTSAAFPPHPRRALRARRPLHSRGLYSGSAFGARQTINTYRATASRPRALLHTSRLTTRAADAT